MIFLLLFLTILPCAYGGSKCPDRSKIHPCICIDRPIGKSKFDTTLVCHGLTSGENLLSIKPALSEMEIDKFLLYDSYWPSGDLRMSLTDSRIPINILSSFRIHEIEIVDTGLSTFGCPEAYNCMTNYLKKFTAINSSMPERASCNNNGLTINFWISCPAHIELLVINRGFPSDLSLKPEFFPDPLTKLKALHLPNNHITRIDKRTFLQTKFPVLHTLDLSHNSLRDAKNIFSSTLKLKHLDLSHNTLRTLVDFQYLPHLTTLKLSKNHIIHLLENEWQIIPANLRHIDLSHNDIQCNCGIQWVNSTFHINTALLGTCYSPPEVATKKLRKASRFLIERCDKDGKIGPKPPKSKGH